MRERIGDEMPFKASKSLYLVLLLGTIGCASANVTPQDTQLVASPVRPSQVVIYDFAVTPDEVSQNSGLLHQAYRATMEDFEQRQQGQLDTGNKVAQDLSAALEQRLLSLGFYTEVDPRGTPLPNNALLIDGSLVKVEEGSLTERLVIGLGLGASKLDTHVNVYQISNNHLKKVLDFSTHADSGRMPGAAWTMGPGIMITGTLSATSLVAAAGSGALKSHQSSIGAQAESTAKQITAYMSEYLAAQGWIPPEDVKRSNVASAS